MTFEEMRACFDLVAHSDGRYVVQKAVLTQSGTWNIRIDDAIHMERDENTGERARPRVFHHDAATLQHDWPDLQNMEWIYEDQMITDLLRARLTWEQILMMVDACAQVYPLWRLLRIEHFRFDEGYWLTVVDPSGAERELWDSADLEPILDDASRFGSVNPT